MYSDGIRTDCMTGMTETEFGFDKEFTTNVVIDLPDLPETSEDSRDNHQEERAKLLSKRQQQTKQKSKWERESRNEFLKDYRKLANGFFKSRLQTESITQQQGADYDETFSPVVNH